MWEYHLRAADENALVAEFGIRLSRAGQHRRIPFYPPIPTLVHLVGWGKDVVDLEVSAAIGIVEFAWAVTELVTGQERPAREFYNHYERLQAARVLEEHFEVSPR